MPNLKPHWMALLGVLLAITVQAASPTTSDTEVRQKLVQALLSTGTEQQNLLLELGDTGAKIVGDVLTAWPRDQVMIFDAPDGAKIPALVGDEEDADGKVTATRIDTGELLKDEAGAARKFSTTEITTAETDGALRKVIQQVRDSLALANPDPNVRRSAILKLGNSQKEQNIPILEARLAKETNKEVKHTIAE